MLPQVHEGQLLCLPALEVWGGLLDPEVGPCASSSSNSASAAAGGAAAAAGKVLLERAHSEGDSAGVRGLLFTLAFLCGPFWQAHVLQGL